MQPLPPTTYIRGMLRVSDCPNGDMLFVNIQDGRCADADDVLPDGFHIRKGDGVYYISYAMGRMTYIWGNDAEDFRPERWLKDGIFQPESPFIFIAFHVSIKLPYLISATPELI